MTAYPLHRRHVWLSLGVCVLAAAILLPLAVVAPMAWKIVCVGLSLALFAAATPSIRLLGDARPVLVLSPEGLLYRPFADRTAPWREITAIAFVRGYTRTIILGRSTWTRQRASDQINFALADYGTYPNGVGRVITRAMQRMGNAPPIVMQLWLVEAEGEAVCAEIAKYWPGQIAIIERRLQDGPAP